MEGVEILLEIILGMMMVMLLIGGALSVLGIIAKWKIFIKAGEKGWKALIPVWNTIIIFKIAGLSPFWILGYFAAFIPGIGVLACIGITIYMNIKLAKAFAQDEGFAVGLILLNLVFMMILAFGKSEYQLKKQKSEEPIIVQ